MTNFTNDDLYQMLLDRLRKDRKGSVSPEEFENFLRYRNLDYYNTKTENEGAVKMNEASLKPFIVNWSHIAVTQDAQSKRYYADLSTITNFGQWRNVWFTTNLPNPTRPDLTGMTYVDIVTEAELPDRLSNSITGPDNSYPVGHFSVDRLDIHGLATVGYAIVSYYRLPTNPYYDYYTDASGNITYLKESQPAYTLAVGEIARDGTTAGGAVTSESFDLEWGDYDAINILDMIVSDVSIALSDSDSFQASMLERQQNVTT